MLLRSSLDLFLRGALPVMVGAAVAFSGVLGTHSSLALIAGLGVAAALLMRLPDHVVALFSAAPVTEETVGPEDFQSQLHALRKLFSDVRTGELDLREAQITTRSVVKMRLMYHDCLRFGLPDEAAKALLLYHALVELLSEEWA